MRILVDTNILTRISQKSHPQSSIADAAVQALFDSDHDLRVVPQVIYEYWAVATRPLSHNGLGFPLEHVAAEVRRFQHIYSVLRDERMVLKHWQQIALDYKVVGKQTHDAHLVAAMKRHGLTHILTFNVADFTRYSGITVLDPAGVSVS